MTFYTSTSSLPPLRRDISGQEVLPGLVALYDEMGYAEVVARLPMDMIEYLTILDGRRSAEVIARQAAQSGRTFSMDEFLEVVNVLEREYFLESERFEARREERDREYNDLPTRPAVHAGSSYSDDPDELRRELDGYLAAGAGHHNGDPAPVAVIAPHIDFRVGGSSYGPVYNALKHSEADTFVIFGVSHQMSYDAFMISEKDFETPLGVVPTDRELIRRFRERLPFAITRNEIAHRSEHSIEFQAVFLRHIFAGRDIRIVPILTGSLYEYVEMGEGNASDDERLTALYDTLAEVAAELGRNVCYIAGADLCHVGRKFGDEFPARDVLAELRDHDAATLEHIARPDPDAFLRHLAAVGNRHRVCGVAPIYATLRAARPRHGRVMGYDQWDEVERESAVTFGSVALYR
ncbi:MAG TPA: AmmeMemoRadiSam system protein B [Candidatus Kapabacteria bacterium]|nr:AmmeMemoRadiSam system protein B [Candidatus Kapabacteria bacterium]